MDSYVSLEQTSQGLGFKALQSIVSVLHCEDLADVEWIWSYILNRNTTFAKHHIMSSHPYPYHVMQPNRLLSGCKQIIGMSRSRYCLIPKLPSKARSLSMKE